MFHVELNDNGYEYSTRLQMCWAQRRMGIDLPSPHISPAIQTIPQSDFTNCLYQMHYTAQEARYATLYRQNMSEPMPPSLVSRARDTQVNH